MGTVTSPARKEIDGATLVRFQMLPLDFKEMITLKNLYLGLKDQLPWKRFFHNFFVTGNAKGLFYKRSHINANGKPKVMYNTKKTANKSAEKLGEKHGTHFSNYKCIYCNGYHLGKNREKKEKKG